MGSDAQPLWSPSAEVVERTNLTRYMRWLKHQHGLAFDSYRGLWHWSVTELEAFWQSIWDFYSIEASAQHSAVLPEKEMPGAQWFPGAELNYAQHVFRNMTDERPAMLYQAEDESIRPVSWQELYDMTVSMVHILRGLGVERGDRVVAYLPHIPETVAAFLACASLGAIWSTCSPDFGGPSVLDRFQQIEPKVLIAVDGYSWNGKIHDRLHVVAELQAALPTLEKTILVPLVGDGTQTEGLENILVWDGSLDASAPALEFEQVPFDHPLWVLYSSGTTGLPKPIVQGHGGILLEHFKALSLHLDLTPDDRFFWFTSTGWMMWNFLIGGLLIGCTIILHNGSPGYPDMDVLWKLAEETGMTYLGFSAAYVSACMKAGIEPGRKHDLTAIRAVGSTGSPLSVEGFKWVYENVHPDLALESVSGGTDLCTAFVGGCRLLPVYAGEIQGASLGAKVEAFNEDGESVVDQVGELVITEPMPSMPLFFWNDPDGERYRASYFEMFPGIWRHGDWIEFNQRGGCVIYGRSDSTINRHGVRMGTAEIYAVVERIDEVVESMVVDLEGLGQESYMPLFVVLKEGAVLDDTLRDKIKARIRQDVSPRHVPNEILEIDEVPRTLSGKKMELPIKKILLGNPVEKAINVGAMRNPDTVQYFLELAQEIKNRSSGD
jgi:acetoacetyl-CoA synthetase